MSLKKFSYLVIFIIQNDSIEIMVSFGDFFQTLIKYKITVKNVQC